MCFVFETVLVADHDDLVKDDDDVLKDLVRAVVVHVDVVVLGDVDELLVLDLLVDDAVALVDELSVVALSDADLDVSYLVDILVDSLSHDVLLEVVIIVVVSLYVVAINLYVVVVNLYVVIAVDILVVVVDTLDVVDDSVSLSLITNEVVEGDLQDVVCLFVHFCVGIREVADVVVLPELLDVDELTDILDVVVSHVVLVDLDIADPVDVIDEALCLELVDVLVVLLVLLQVLVEDVDICEEVLDDRGVI